MSTNSNFIKINVGGTIISTLKGTLTKEPESMLARIINTKVPIERDHEGNIFIDRCGEKFKLIIEFLRTGDLKLTNSSYTEEDIEKEAEYFMLASLLHAIRRGPKEDGVRDLILVNIGPRQGVIKGPFGPIWRLRVRRGAEKYQFTVAQKLFNATLHDMPGLSHEAIDNHDNFVYRENFHLTITQKRSVWFCVQGPLDGTAELEELISINSRIIKNWDEIWKIAKECPLVERLTVRKRRRHLCQSHSGFPPYLENI